MRLTLEQLQNIALLYHYYNGGMISQYQLDCGLEKIINNRRYVICA
jgi:hypothetical protein